MSMQATGSSATYGGMPLAVTNQAASGISSSLGGVSNAFGAASNSAGRIYGQQQSGFQNSEANAAAEGAGLTQAATAAAGMAVAYAI